MLDTKILQERSVYALELNKKLRLFLKNFNTYVNNNDSVKEINDLPQLLKNSLPSQKDQELANLLIQELLEHDRHIIESYDSFIDTSPA